MRFGGEAPDGTEAGGYPETPKDSCKITVARYATDEEILSAAAKMSRCGMSEDEVVGVLNSKDV